MTGGDGTLAQFIVYMPFGEALVNEQLVTHHQPYKFTGKPLDIETGLYYFGARYYCPVTVRWYGVNPKAHWYYSLSPYTYVANNPIALIDPNGKWIESAWDLISLGAGVNSLINNVQGGNYSGAIVDGLGVAFDAFATIVPVLPGGAGAGIKALRATGDAVQATRASKSATDLASNTPSVASPASNLPNISQVEGVAGDAKGSSQYLYHYTSETAAQNIVKTGLKTGKDGFVYITNKGGLSPLQAQIELALPANRALPTSILRIDASGLSPSIIRSVQGNLPGMGAGGGTEFLFNQNIPAYLIQIIK